jgi:UDP-N-acetylmuramate dehydrogenase
VTDGRLDERQIGELRSAFGARLEQNVPLARHTSARIGGPADFFLTAGSAAELAETAERLWSIGARFRVLGGGSNVLVSDRGVREVIVLNQARVVTFDETTPVPRARAESGANFGSVARRAVEHGLSGLEWAGTVPGTVGGAVVGNAGAHGSDVAGCLESAAVLERGGRPEAWPVQRFDYRYRGSALKDRPGSAVVLEAVFRLERSSPETARDRLASFVAHRQRTQPSGASVGSMFKNPPGDFAGRLIEAAGLKGLRRGAAMISDLHANFFINRGGARADDVWELLRVARETVAERFGIELELEIELLGEWQAESLSALQGRPGVG